MRRHGDLPMYAPTGDRSEMVELAEQLATPIVAFCDCDCSQGCDCRTAADCKCWDRCPE